MYIRIVIQMDIIKVKFTFLVTFAEGRENVIGNGHMKTLMGLLWVISYVGCGPLNICHLFSVLF